MDESKPFEELNDEQLKSVTGGGIGNVGGFGPTASPEDYCPEEIKQKGGVCAGIAFKPK